MNPIVDVNNIVTLKFNGDIVLFSRLRKTFSEPKLLLWCRNGLFRVIPGPIIREAIFTHDLFRKQNMPDQIALTWDQGVGIDQSIGKMLLGE